MLARCLKLIMLLALSLSTASAAAAQFVMMFERDVDSGAGAEVAFRFYADLAGLLSNTPSGPDVFSPINVAGTFSTSGLAAIVPATPPPPNGIPLPGTLLLLSTGLLLMSAFRPGPRARPRSFIGTV